MFWVYIITMVVLGLLAASKKIEDLIPASKQLTDFLKQSEGWIGVVSIGLSIYWLIMILSSISVLIKYAFLRLIISLVCVAIMFLLGMLFSQSLFKQWFSGNEKAVDIIGKITGFASPFKEPMGLLAIVSALIVLGLAL